MIKSKKENFSNNFETSDITDSKTLWKTVKPFCTDENESKIENNTNRKFFFLLGRLKELVSEKIISGNQIAAEIFNNFLVIFVTNLTTCADHGYDTNFIVTDNQVPRAVNNFSSHPSIITIKNKKKKKMIKAILLVQ